MAARLKREEEAEEKEEEDIPSSEDYLREIRDLLAAQKTETNSVDYRDL